MKQNKLKALVKQSICICTALFILSSSSAVKANNLTGIKIEEKKEKDKKDKGKKNTVSKRSSSVRISPDIARRTIYVRLKRKQTRNAELFVFDHQGSMVQNYKLSPRKKIKLKGLNRGTYTYSVFSGDELTASGQLEVK
jgi:lipopolysaccharide export LptBFGC system permease protein LptF